LKLKVKDPLSGFFMLKRSFFDAHKDKLSLVGSKILMDLLMSSQTSVRFKEVPISFKPRFKGYSKHHWLLVWQNCLVAMRK
jgi:dolichol-phosphate mannosyltransferase